MTNVGQILTSRFYYYVSIFFVRSYRGEWSLTPRRYCEASLLRKKAFFSGWSSYSNYDQNMIMYTTDIFFLRYLKADSRQDQEHEHRDQQYCTVCLEHVRVFVDRPATDARRVKRRKHAYVTSRARVCPPRCVLHAPNSMTRIVETGCGLTFQH